MPRAPRTPLLLCAALVLAVAATAGPREDPDDVIDVVAPDSLAFAQGGDTLRLRLYRSHDFETPHPEITRAVYMVHGTRRNADDYYQDIADGAAAAGMTGECFLVAPQYMVAADIEAHQLGEDLLYWQYYGWRQGDLSDSTATHPRPWRLSSFSVADSILRRLSDLCPNLESVVVAGHSAGGQFANRYAAGNAVHDSLAARGVELSYVVANPSTYLYFNEDRWVEGTGFHFAPLSPEQIAECPGYNDYKYGLENPNVYMALGDSTLRARFAERTVITLVGEWDDNPWDHWLDRSCPAMLQGEIRRTRGLVYFHYLQHYFGPSIVTEHPLAMVYHAGHSHSAMFGSDCGLHYLFGYGGCWLGWPDCGWTEVTTSLLDPSDTEAASWGDFDGDGDADLFLSGEPGTETLLRNEGGSFSESTAPPLPSTGRSVQACWVDLDDDGDLDLYQLLDPEPNRLLLNQGLGIFTEQTPAELALGEGCRHAAWADYDRDGDLDLYLCRADGLSNLLLRNEGGLAFADVTAAPLDITADTHGAAWGDYDSDGDSDLFLACDGPNFLLRNEGYGIFKDASGITFQEDRPSRSAVFGDYDNDGNFDLLVTNLGTPNRLYRNAGDSYRVVCSAHVADSTAMTRSGTFVDYNNDGRLDIHLANEDGINRLCYNRGAGSFSYVDCHPIWDGRATHSTAWADYDRDGDEDLYLGTGDGGNWLLRNDNPTQHWLRVDLRGVESNRFGVGARVRLSAGGQEQWRQVTGASGPGAFGPAALSFGLGEEEYALFVQVFWPSGAFQETLMVDADQEILLVEDDTSSTAPPWQAGEQPFLHAAHPNPFTAETSLLFDLPADGRVSLSVYDIAGRRVRRIVADQPREAGRHLMSWDGRDDGGHAVAAGVYLCRLETEGGALTRRMVRVR